MGGRRQLPMKLCVSVSYKEETYKEKAIVDTGNLIYSGGQNGAASKTSYFTGTGCSWDS